MFSLIVMAALAGEIPSGLDGTARQFLDAYARGDDAQVMSMTTKGDLHIYGSDAAEAIEGRKAFRLMMADDQKLWGGKASIGPMTHVSSTQSGKLATLFFDADFTLNGNTVPIRFATVWRKEHGGWKLVQESNVVPTTGQSATEILNKVKP
ncbi:MAG: nuclear transport factor 2 family protein [Pseudomonadota bacterium]